MPACVPVPSLIVQYTRPFTGASAVSVISIGVGPQLPSGTEMSEIETVAIASSSVLVISNGSATTGSHVARMGMRW